MSSERITRVKCDGCGKMQDCLPGDLRRRIDPNYVVVGAVRDMDTIVPNGWFLVTACVRDQWTEKFGKTISINSGDDGPKDHHACSRSCAAELLGKIANLVLFPGE
jgi:hypothetical protein